MTMSASVTSSTDRWAVTARPLALRCTPAVSATISTSNGRRLLAAPVFGGRERSHRSQGLVEPGDRGDGRVGRRDDADPRLWGFGHRTRAYGTNEPLVLIIALVQARPRSELILPARRHEGATRNVRRFNHHRSRDRILAERLTRRRHRARAPGLRPRPPRLERDDRQAPGGDRALRRRRSTSRPPCASPPSTSCRSPFAAAGTTSRAPPWSMTAS